MDIQYLKDNYEIRDGHLYYKKPGPHRTVGCRAGSVNDDGPLTDAQMAAIRAASPVSNLPEERITRRLF